MHQILGMRLPGGGLVTVGSVPSPRDSGKWPRSWLNPKLSDSVTQEQLGEDGHGAHSSRQGLPRCEGH